MKSDVRNSMSDTLAGKYFLRGEEGYEEARRSSVWHAGVPDRFPEVIVQAHSEADVVAAVRAAVKADLKVGVCSGRRSWTANHLRDGGMLLDLSRLREAHVDAAAMKASAQPGLWAADFIKELAAQDLFFPGGHCTGVALGGYLLQGGYGWSGRAYGPACASVEAIDVVTADGELLHADDAQNSDLLWAARGSGAGYFGVVTRFYVRLYPLPKVIASASYRYPIDVLDEVLAWTLQVGPRLAPFIDFELMIQRNDGGTPEITIGAPAFASTKEEAARALSILQTCPVLDRAISAVPNVPTTMRELVDMMPMLQWAPYRWFGDNMWTHGPVEKLLPGIHRIIEALPEPPGYLQLMPWGRDIPLIDMAFDLQDDAYIAIFSAGTDPAEDSARAAWTTDSVRWMEAAASGAQLADENLGRRPVKFMSDEHMARLDQIRAARDPHGRFHSWMGRL